MLCPWFKRAFTNKDRYLQEKCCIWLHCYSLALFFWIWEVPRAVCIRTGKCIFVIILSYPPQELKPENFQHLATAWPAVRIIFISILFGLESPFCAGWNCFPDYDWKFHTHILIFTCCSGPHWFKTNEKCKTHAPLCIVYCTFRI